MKKFILFIAGIIFIPILILFLFNVIANFINCSELSECTKLSRKIIGKTADILYKEKKIRLGAFGGRANSGKEEVMTIGLTSTDGPLNINEARKLLIYCCRTFLREINNFEKIRPHLITYPFTEKNINVSLLGHNKNNETVLPPFIACAVALEGKVYYDIDENNVFKTVHTESYAEAIKIVDSQRNSGRK